MRRTLPPKQAVQEKTCQGSRDGAEQASLEETNPGHPVDSRQNKGIQRGGKQSWVVFFHHPAAEQDMLASVMCPGTFVWLVSGLKIQRRISGEPNQPRHQNNDQKRKHEPDLGAPCLHGPDSGGSAAASRSRLRVCSRLANRAWSSDARFVGSNPDGRLGNPAGGTGRCSISSATSLSVAAGSRQKPS